MIRYYPGEPSVTTRVLKRWKREAGEHHNAAAWEGFHWLLLGVAGYYWVLLVLTMEGDQEPKNAGSVCKLERQVTGFSPRTSRGNTATPTT